MIFFHFNWLKVKERLEFIFSIIVWKALHDKTPNYILDSLVKRLPTIRSHYSQDLQELVRANALFEQLHPPLKFSSISRLSNGKIDEFAKF